MQDHLEVEVADNRAGRANVIPRSSGLIASRMKGPVYRLQSTEDGISTPVEARRRGDREDRVALELGDGKVGLNPIDDGIKQLAQHRVTGGDTGAEVDAVGLLDTGHEARVPRDVGQQKVSLTGC